MGVMILVDILLLVSTLVHLLVTISIWTPIDSPLKKPLVKLTYKASLLLLDIHAVQTFALVTYLAIFIMLVKDWSAHDLWMRTRCVAAFFILITAPALMKSNHILRTFGPTKTLEIEQEVMNKDIMTWTPPPLEAMNKMLVPYYCLFKYDVVGIERAPKDYPCFYVMNHSLYGLEMPAFIHVLYKERGVFVRGLADHFHWMGPHGPLLRQFGAVDGTRPNVDLLMSDKQNVLVYPGGGQEILKPKAAMKYELLWKERLGFARMAIKNRYPILPCACVGNEDMLDILFDLPVNFLAGATSITSLPVAAPNSLQKIYFWFGEPISTEKYDGDADNTEFAKELRDKTKAAVEAGIKELQARQAEDPDRFLMDRIAKDIRSAQTQARDLLKSLLGSIKADWSLWAAALIVSHRLSFLYSTVFWEASSAKKLACFLEAENKRSLGSCALLELWRVAVEQKETSYINGLATLADCSLPAADGTDFHGPSWFYLQEGSSEAQRSTQTWKLGSWLCGLVWWLEKLKTGECIIGPLHGIPGKYVDFCLGCHIFLTQAIKARVLAITWWGFKEKSIETPGNLATLWPKPKPPRTTDALA